MNILRGKKIVLGISGGIAAYKTTFLVRLLIKAGAEVQVIMSPASKDFVSPLTLSTLSQKPVFDSFLKDENGITSWNNHVDFGLWADLVIIAPATANTMSKMANGTCDNLLLATYLSAKCPVYIAPAMDLDMYKHGSTKQNLTLLESFGNKIIPAESGELASGLIGEGRMAEPENIIDFITADLEKDLPLKNKTILVTAGPTYEKIDPVRFIGNHSSGLMGFEIVKTLLSKGAKVILISGPTNYTICHNNCHLIKVITAQEMFNAVFENYSTCDVAIAAAAVADYRPKNPAKDKIKKKDLTFTIELEKTQDILFEMGKQKDKQFLIGFALETNNELENAKGKLERKKLDLIVLNSLNDEGAGFGFKTNKVTFINKNSLIEEKELKSKTEVALDIVNKIINWYDV